MTTTGTTNFDLNLIDVVEEAYARCGKDFRTGYDLSTARRSLNLLTLEWANRGINLWTIEEGSIPLTSGTAVYDLPLDTIDLLDHVIRTGSGSNQQDISISRISVSSYAAIPNKNNTGRPIQVWVDRKSGAELPSGFQNPKVNLWPVPDSATTYTFVYWRMRRIKDAGNGVETQDIPFRLLPCMVAGLAYYLSLKVPEATPRIEMLKMAYEEQWLFASGEDREKAAVRFVPREFYLGGG